MLDSDTKRRINTCRDILVGKVPDPKSQVEQITIALIYKFMDDMDLESEEMGGARTFFAGEYERYAWARLVAPGVGGQEMLNTYTEALTKMVENPGIPELFRSIFRNAYLPYRDPETLRSFLREINGFTYDHSERLGDAFEYLLSVLGSQGDAGQFRTPRHIIDFMVEIIDPKKDEVILDPACGTAGFLISSYKHVLKANSTDPYSNGAGVEVDAAEATLDSPLRYSGDLLTTEDRQRLASNIKGYDISPDMVRLSLVNLYLHGFADPKVEEYDTLTSDDKWGETADVILANPPFMSPKGGIKPHNRFGVASKRSEVLFVDYIAEHLNPKGRAAIVVPEGIIFQSQSAYCDLRRLLVDKYLAAVISLPAGVFNPYSGVKTSILILDRTVAKMGDSIAFFKVENDGFGLGAQRRAVNGSQLPQVKAELAAWLDAARRGEGAVLESHLGHAVPKARICDGGEYNLSGERYREDATKRNSVFPIVPLSEVISSLESGVSVNSENRTAKPGEFGILKTSAVTLGVFDPCEHKAILPEEIGRAKCSPKRDSIIISRMNTEALVGASAYVDADYPNLFLPDRLWQTVITRNDVSARFVHIIISSELYRTKISAVCGGTSGSMKNIGKAQFLGIEIPLPPLNMQREIVSEIDSYQKIIDGARAVLENYRPHIPIDPAWPIANLGSLAKFKNGLNFTKDEAGYTIAIVGVGDFQNNLTVPIESLSSVTIADEIGDEYLLRGGDILFVRSNGNPDLVGRSMLVPDEIGRASFSGFTIRARVTSPETSSRFLTYFFKSADFANRMKTVGQGASIRNLSQGILDGLQIPIPPLETQQAIVAEIEAEQKLVGANRELIARFETKIEQAIARVWGGVGEDVT